MKGSSAHRARRVTVLALLVLLGIATTADAAILHLHASAIDKTLTAQVFTREGRYVLAGDPRGCTYSYVEMPRSSLRSGRYYLRVRFSARAGGMVSGQCKGSGDSFDIVVSARPYLRGTVVGLEDYRLEEGKDAYRPLLELLVTQAMPQLIRYDVKEEVARMLRSSATPYQVSVPLINVRSLTADKDEIDVEFEFEVDAR